MIKRKVKIAIIIFLIIIALFLIIIPNKKIINGFVEKIMNYSDEQEPTDTIYLVNSKTDEYEDITIIISNRLGIDKIITPEDEMVIDCNGKEKVAIDYKIYYGNVYTFKVKLQNNDEIREYILNPNQDTKPKITITDSAEYATLTESGAQIYEDLSIDYGSYQNQYYSFDDGKTWLKYEGTIRLYWEGNIQAKTILDGQITEMAKQAITWNLNNDAIHLKAYDGDETTYTTNTVNQYILVDNNVINKTVRFNVAQNRDYPGWVQFLGEDDIVLEYKRLNSSQISDFVIPVGTKKISYKPYNAWGDLDKLYEILILREGPEIEKHYGTLTYESIYTPYITIKNSEETEKTYYKIGDESEWTEYQEGEKIYTEELDKIIYARATYTVNDTIYGKRERETTISSQTMDDFIGKEAYDGDENTYTTATANQYILVDNSVINKTVRFNVAQNRDYPGWVQFLGEDDTIIENNRLNSSQISDFVIPVGTKKISYKPYNAWGNLDQLYEMSIIRESPTIEKHYGTLTYESIYAPYITINSSSEMEKTYYKIGDDGEWIEYQEGKKIYTEELKKKVYAKGIYMLENDIYGSSERETIISSQTMDDFIGKEAYDGDETTYTTATANQYILVDNSVINKTVRFNVAQNSDYPGWVQFLGEDDTIIENNRLNSSQISDFVIPVGTKKISYKPYNAWGNLDKLYEMSIIE